MIFNRHVFCLTFFFAAAGVCAPQAHGADGRSVVVFASERIMNGWVESDFHALASGREVTPNECEAAVMEGMKDAGFVIFKPPPKGRAQDEARRFHTVFARYNDISSMPNESAARAATIFDSTAVAVIACGVRASQKKGGSESVCADARCKAVDIKSRRRIATTSDMRCVENQADVAGSIIAIRDVCAEMGRAMASKFEGKY